MVAFLLCTCASTRALQLQAGVSRRGLLAGTCSLGGLFLGGDRCLAASLPAAFVATAAKVPVFVITTPDGSTPLFTDSAVKGSKALDRASFYAERRDAERRLKQLKLKDDEGAIMSLPLTEALDLRSQPSSELGGSFVLEANRGERDDATAIAHVDMDPDDLPLFFDPRLAAKDGTNFVFLKKADLDGAWLKAAGGKLRDAGYPNYRVTSVRSLAERPQKDGPPFAIITSERF